MLAISLKEVAALLLAFAGSMFVAWFSIPLVVNVASMRNLTDCPGSRKVHKKEIPTLGGIGIFAGFSFGFLMSVNGYLEGVTYFVVATLMLFFVGMKDDLITIDPKKRLVAEILAALCLIYFTGIRITDFHGFLGIGHIPVWLTYISTIFMVVVIINAVNLIDGIDGLAASTGIISSLTLAAWFLLSGYTGYTIMSLALAGTLFGFLRFNLSRGKNKIFMGDTGSLLIGFILATLTICFNEVNTGSFTYRDLHSAPAIAIAILIVPLFDTLRVFTVRILRGQHPFTADNRHIHHLMLRAGYSHRRSTFILCIVQILIIALAFALDHIGILWLTLALLAVCMMLAGVVFVLVYRRYLLKGTSVWREDKVMIRRMIYVHRLFRKKEVLRRVQHGMVVRNPVVHTASFSSIPNPVAAEHLSFPKLKVEVEE